MHSKLSGKSILVTGGTGSFGKVFVETVLRQHDPKRVIVFSRDELKQFDMKRNYEGESRLRFFLGDVRDSQRVHRALNGVDIVIHAAALKQVPTLEYNPFEAVKTNIIGAENLINAAIDQGVHQLVALSTDKAVNPVNLYGATKLCAEKLFVAGNSYSGEAKTRFSVVRYGNVVGSRGSVIPFFMNEKRKGILPVTDPRMTRFWITLDQAAALVFRALDVMLGGEILVPKIPSMKITDLLQAIAPECKTKIIGIRPGEKLHEVLLMEDESRHAIELEDMYMVLPDHPFWMEKGYHHPQGKPLADGFRYSSDTNPQWLTVNQLKALIYSKSGQAEETQLLGV